MQKKIIFTVLAIGAVVVLLPADVLAGTTELIGKDFSDKTSWVQDLLFGPVLRIVGVMAGAWGLMQALLSGSMKPLIIFGAIGLTAGLMKTFIDGVFNAA